MSHDKLSIIKEEAKRKNSSQSFKREEVKNYLNSLWQENAAQFDPLLNAIGEIRVKKTFEMINRVFSPDGKKVADLGTGTALFSLHLHQKKALVDAVDLANIPVDRLREKKLENFRTFQDYIPKTTLESDFYDLVLALEVIAYLNKDEYRLFFAELARLVKLEGIVIVSTPIDIYSEDALQNFASLAESEFDILEWKLSYHNYYIRLLKTLEAPAIFVKASKDKSFYQKELKKRHSINKTLFKINSSKIVSYFWGFIKLFSNPLLHFVKKSRFILLKMENLCRFFSSETGISHALFAGKRRRVFEEVAKDDIPIERKGKRQVWE
ncbi:MAG TPA: methyltransferase domain-containing protein [Parachlamydiaceae bacterium]|nr:methyltransferase domain-containing protein [Parachlamydiaceae bacterium]